jgi:hypothetical protein
MRTIRGLIWASPVRDVAGFMWRYWLLGVAIALVGIGGAIVGDQFDRYLLQRMWRSVSADGAYFYGTICNIVFAARFTFFLFAFIEFATIVGLVVAAFRQRSEMAEVAVPMPRAAAFMRTVSKFILMVLALSFLHLGLYAIAFHYEDCTRWTGLRQLRDYVALAGFSIMYAGGSMLLIGCCLIGLRRYLVRTKSA